MCPTAVDPAHPDSYYSVARPSGRDHARCLPARPVLQSPQPGGALPDHRAGDLAPDRRPHHPPVASIGTGGTITGIGRYLKAQNPDIQIIGADPEGSVYSGGSGRPYLVEGIGEDFWPDAYDRQIADQVVMVSDRDSFLTARRVTRQEGILVGGSAGTAVWAALQVGHEAGRDAVIVVVIPDSGRGYLSKLYDDSWMADHGFLRSGGSIGADRQRAAGPQAPQRHA